MISLNRLEVLNFLDETKHVYFVKFKDGCVKIGISKDPENRIRTLVRQSGRTNIDAFISERLPKEKAMRIEAMLHLVFGRDRMKGEYFTSDFDEVVSAYHHLIGRIVD